MDLSRRALIAATGTTVVGIGGVDAVSGDGPDTAPATTVANPTTTVPATTAPGRTTAPPNADRDFGGWFDDVSNYTGVVDFTDRDTVIVHVGGDGNGGEFAFALAAIRISAGTRVVFEWISDNHDVAVESRPDASDWQGHEAVENEGYEYENVFDVPGTYTYYCEPHLALGMKGAIVVEDDGSAGATTEPAASHSGDVVVGPGGDLVFSPDSLTVPVGATVTWRWDSDNHSVVPEDLPDDAEWEGTPGGESETYDEGYVYRHTFDVPGRYSYYCAPHRAAGMVGELTVVEDEATTDRASPEPSPSSTAGNSSTAASSGDPSNADADSSVAFEAEPGFGVFGAVGSLLAGGFLARRRRG